VIGIKLYILIDHEYAHIELHSIRIKIILVLYYYRRTTTVTFYVTAEKGYHMFSYVALVYC